MGAAVEHAQWEIGWQKGRTLAEHAAQLGGGSEGGGLRRHLPRRSGAIERWFINSDGASAVEFSLVLPLLLMLILGIVEFGTVFYRQAIIAWASREGARTGIVANNPKPTAAQIQAAVAMALNQAGLDTIRASVSVSGAGGAFGTDLVVQVEAPYRFQFLPALVPGMRSSVTLRGRTVMRHE